MQAIDEGRFFDTDFTHQSRERDRFLSRVGVDSPNEANVVCLHCDNDVGLFDAGGEIVTSVDGGGDGDTGFFGGGDNSLAHATTGPDECDA